MNNLNFKLKDIVDTAVGHFTITDPRDQWILDRTRQWCGLYTQHEWCYRINISKGVNSKNVIAFDFTDQNDAENFRRITARSPTLITCR